MPSARTSTFSSFCTALADRFYSDDPSGSRWDSSRFPRARWIRPSEANERSRNVAKIDSNTVPEKTLLAFAESGALEGGLDVETTEADAVVEDVGKAGIDVDALASQLQAEGRDSFVQSWNDLLACIESKRKSMRAV